MGNISEPRLRGSIRPQGYGGSSLGAEPERLRLPVGRLPPLLLPESRSQTAPTPISLPERFWAHRPGHEGPLPGRAGRSRGRGHAGRDHRWRRPMGEVLPLVRPGGSSTCSFGAGWMCWSTATTEPRESWTSRPSTRSPTISPPTAASSTPTPWPLSTPPAGRPETVSSLGLLCFLPDSYDAEEGKAGLFGAVQWIEVPRDDLGLRRDSSRQVLDVLGDPEPPPRRQPVAPGASSGRHLVTPPEPRAGRVLPEPMGRGMRDIRRWRSCRGPRSVTSAGSGDQSPRPESSEQSTRLDQVARYDVNHLSQVRRARRDAWTGRAGMRPQGVHHGSNQRECRRAPTRSSWCLPLGNTTRTRIQGRLRGTAVSLALRTSSSRHHRKGRSSRIGWPSIGRSASRSGPPNR